jgi:hypothetical protein
VAIANGEVTASNILRGPACTLRFGSTVIQSLSYHFNLSPVEALLQGAGALTSGSITFECEGSGNSATNMSVTAYVVSAVN